jgi:hypothetical protein
VDGVKGRRVGSLRVARVLLIGVAIVAAGVMLSKDRDNAFAAHTSVFYTFSTSSPAQVTSVTTFPGNQPVLLHVWAANVDDPQGLGAFQVILRYDPAFMQVGMIEESTDWLDNTGRTPSCPVDDIGPVPGDPVLWQARAICATITNPPPYGPLGSGKIAEFTILPGPSYGVTPLTNLTVLTDPGQIVPGDPPTVLDPQVIPANEITAQIRTARCGDFNNDDAVSGLDFFGLLGKFGLVEPMPGWDDIFDMNDDGAISGQDFFILLGMFGAVC